MARRLAPLLPPRLPDRHGRSLERVRDLAGRQVGILRLGDQGAEALGEPGGGQGSTPESEIWSMASFSRMSALSQSPTSMHSTACLASCSAEHSRR